MYQCVKSRWPDVLFAAKWTHGACASSRESARTRRCFVANCAAVNGCATGHAAVSAHAPSAMT